MERAPSRCRRGRSRRRSFPDRRRRPPGFPSPAWLPSRARPSRSPPDRSSAPRSPAMASTVRIGTENVRVLAVAAADRLRERPRTETAGGPAHPGAYPCERRAARRVVGPGDRDGRPAEGRRADVAGTVGGVAPAAVHVLVLDQPRDAAADERAEGRLRPIPVDQRQRDDRRGGRKRGRRQLAGPMPVRGARGEQSRGQPVERFPATSSPDGIVAFDCPGDGSRRPRRPGCALTGSDAPGRAGRRRCTRNPARRRPSFRRNRRSWSRGCRRSRGTDP